MGINRISMATTLLILAIVILLMALYFYPAEKNNENNVMPEENGWRMIYGNPQGTCVGDYNTSHLTGKILWSKYFSGKIKGLLVNGNNTLYALVGNKIFSLDAGGNIVWKSNINFSSAMPAVDEYGNIYASTPSGDVVSLNKNGHVRWKYHLDENERVKSPLIIQDKGIYIITNTGSIYVLNSQGKLISKVSLEQKTDLPPVISPTRSIYVGINSSVYKISPQGSVEWNLTLEGKILRMAFYEEHLYVTTLKVVYSHYPVVKNITPYLFALSQDGGIEWKVNLDVFGEKVGNPIALSVYNDTVYVGTHVPYLPSGLSGKVRETQNHSFIMKFDTQGHLIWKRGFYKIIEGLSISKDGFIYATFSPYEQMGNNSCKIYALNDEGNILWSRYLGSSIYFIGDPIIGPETVYVYGGNYLWEIV